MPRRPKNLRPDLNGILVIDKHVGPSSFAICRDVRRATGGAKVGHAGTLDPFASGVLVLALGKATKAVPTLMATDKRYTATVDLGAFSTTDDPEGEITQVDVIAPPPLDRIEAALGEFTGEIQQQPPIYSAVHVDGERAYKLARRGGLEERPPARTVVVHSIEVIEYAFPRLVLDIRCGKGVYIRSLARDLGVSLGVGGMLTALRRTQVGTYTIDDAISMDSLPDPIENALGPVPT
jgi:tRNA pseudouridine55 synthase